MHFEGYDDLEPRSGISGRFCQQLSASGIGLLQAALAESAVSSISCAPDPSGGIRQQG
jgi:hypothetical protein